MKKYSVILCLFILFLAQPVRAESRTVRVGFFKMAGYHEMDDNGVMSGYGYDFLQMARTYADVNFEYVGYDLSQNELIDLLEAGEIDLLTFIHKTQDTENRFLFSQPIGTESIKLNTRQGNSQFIAGDYATYNRMRVGTLTDVSQQYGFDNFARSHHFSYYLFLAPSNRQLMEMMERGEIDAIASSSFRKENNEITLDEFNAENFYAIVRKDDKALLDELNYAINCMDTRTGSWREQLYYRHYRMAQYNSLKDTTRELRTLIRYRGHGDSLRVAANPLNPPYSYLQDGEMKGIIPDYFRQLANHLKLNYEFVIPDSIEAYFALYDSHGADLILDAINDPQSLEKQGYLSTDSFMKLTIAEVINKTYQGTNSRVGFVTWQKDLEQYISPNVEVVSYPDHRALGKAVERNEVNHGIFYAYTAQHLINRSVLNSLTYISHPEGSYDMRFAIDDALPHGFCSILNREINSINKIDMGAIINRYTQYPAANMSLSTWLKLHPRVLYAGIIFSTLTAAALIFLCYARVTDRKHRIQLEKEKAIAEEANRAKSVFLSNMSHDIRTPMNAVIGFTERALRHMDEREILQDSLEKLTTSGNYMLSIINDVLDMARIESGKAEIKEALYHCPADFFKFCDILSADAKNKGITLISETTNIQDEYIWFDAEHIMQVISNLISNAVKYSKPGGTVRYNVLKQPSERVGYAKFISVIEDQGIGMSAEFLERIFQPFERAQSATKSGKQGTGLGMSIVKRLTDLMGGTIEIASELGKGTKITLTFEHRVATPEEIAAYEREHEPIRIPEAPQTRKRILLTDDNVLNLEIAEEILTEAGFLVETAEDGDIAVEAVRVHAADYYDAVLMDLQMPRVSGYEAARAIRELPNQQSRHLPIIAFSANAYDEDRRESAEAGMDAHIAKPLNVQELLNTLTNVI